MFVLMLNLVSQSPVPVLADSLEIGDYQAKLFALTVDPGGENEDVLGMRLYLLSGQDTVLELGDEDWPFLFIDKETGSDVDGDGSPDLVVVMTGQSNVKLAAYSLRPDGVKEVIFSMPEWAEMVSYEDVNGDGVPELLVSDLRIKDFEGLEIPEVVVPLRKQSGGYWEEEPEAYNDFYSSKLESLLAKLRMQVNPFKKKGLAVAYAMYLFHMGKTDEAWNEFLRLTDQDEDLLMKLKERVLFWEPEE